MAVCINLMNLMIVHDLNVKLFYISDSIFQCFVNFFSSVFSSISLLIVIVLGASYAPAQLRLEGLTFALFVASQHFGTLLSAYGSAILTKSFGLTQTNYSHISEFIIVCSACDLLPLILIPILLVDKRENLTSDSAPSQTSGI